MAWNIGGATSAQCLTKCYHAKVIEDGRHYMKYAAVIRHEAFEDLAAFEPPFRAAGYEPRYIDAWDCEQHADAIRDADVLVVMGGPIGVYEEVYYPFLVPEVALVQERLEAGGPLMGVCLGAQLIAKAAGARVYPSGTQEIGFAPIALTDAGRASCLAPFETEPMTLHWHGDTFDLPEGAALLASSEVCKHQAFSMGPRVIGFQFHPEAGGSIEPWLVGHACELSSNGLDIPGIRADAERYMPALAAKARRVVEAWLAGL